MLDTELLLKVKEQILLEPERFDMEFYVERRKCGAVCCIAGWAHKLKYGRHMPKGRFMSVNTASGARALGLSLDEADALFFSTNWPIDWQRRWENEWGDAPEQALVAAALIDQVIKRGGVWWANEVDPNA